MLRKTRPMGSKAAAAFGSAAALAVLLGVSTLAIGADATAPEKRPADAPADATGLCGDGGYTRKTERRGACRGRDGVKAYWGLPGGPASALQPAGSASGAPPAQRAPSK